MEENDLFKISTVARLTGLTAEGIRFYQRKGLVKPSIVDDNNNYRYYSIKDVCKLLEFRYLRGIGLSLQQILSINSDTLDIDNLIKNLELELTQVKNSLSFLHSVRDKTFNVEISPPIEMNCLVKEYSAANMEDLMNISMHFSHYIFATYPKAIWQTGMCWFEFFDKSPEFQQIKFKIFVRLLSGECVEAETVKMGKCAHTYHYGAYETLGETYDKLKKFCKRHHYSISGNFCEKYVQSFLTKSDEKQYITEVFVPID